MTRASRIAVVTATVAVAITIFVIAVVVSDTEDSEFVVSANPGLERLIPARDAEILRQDRIGVDLAPGWDARLTINGTPIPRSQLERGSDLTILFYAPGEGRVIERLSESRNCAQVQIWRVADGPESAGPPIQWCFQVL